MVRHAIWEGKDRSFVAAFMERMTVECLGNVLERQHSLKPQPLKVKFFVITSWAGPPEDTCLMYTKHFLLHLLMQHSQTFLLVATSGLY